MTAKQNRLPWPSSVDSEQAMLQSLIQAVNQNLLMAESGHRYRRRVTESPAAPELLGLALDMEWRADVGNTHECPHNGVQNWGRRNPDAPTSYPGWVGRVWLRLSRQTSGFASDCLAGTGLYTGSGGGGSYDGVYRTIMSAWYSHKTHLNNDPKFPEPKVYSWDARMFDADWPGLANVRMLEQAESYLSTGVRAPKIKMAWEWQHADAVRQDQEFIAMTKMCPGCNPGTSHKSLTSGYQVS